MLPKHPFSLARRCFSRRDTGTRKRPMIIELRLKLVSFMVDIWLKIVRSHFHRTFRYFKIGFRRVFDESLEKFKKEASVKLAKIAIQKNVANQIMCPQSYVFLMSKPCWRLTASAKASGGELWGEEWRVTVFMTASKSYSQWKHRSHLSLGFLLLRLFCSSELLLTELFEKKHRRLFLGWFFFDGAHTQKRKKKRWLPKTLL